MGAGQARSVSLPRGPLAAEAFVASEMEAGREEEEEEGWRVANDHLSWLPPPFRRSIMG